MRRADATRLYYALQILLSMPTWVVMSVYLVQELHLSPLQLVLMGTAMEAAVFLFEIPTGVIADTYSRRLSLIIGYLGMGTAWMLVGLVSAPWLIIALWGVWGLSYTFTSGAEEAWIADEVGADKVGRVFLRGARVWYIGAVLGLVLQVAIGIESLRAGVVVGGAITVLAGLVCLFLMPETGFQRKPRAERGSAVAELRTTAASGRPLCVGGAGDPAPGRCSALHGHVRRGVRPAQGGALPAGRRPARGRRPRPGRVVRDLLARGAAARVRRDGLADQALRAGRPARRHQLSLRADGDGDGDDARFRADRARSGSRSPRCSASSSPATWPGRCTRSG